MTGYETSERNCTAPGETSRSPEGTNPERPVPVLGAYDAVKGTDSFIVAAVDGDDAWLAVETGGERTLREWR